MAARARLGSGTDPWSRRPSRRRTSRMHPGSCWRATIPAIATSTFGRTILDASAQPAGRRAASPLPRRQPGDDSQSRPTATVLDALDMSLTLDEADYKARLAAAAGPPRGADRRARPSARRAVVAVVRGQRRRRQGRQHPPRHGRRSTRAATASTRSPRRPRRSGASPTSGASGGTCRAGAASRSSTAPGTAASWSSGSRASRARATGCAPTARSTTSRSS